MNVSLNLLERITFDKNILGGKPLIRGLRISVAMILELLAKGATSEEILEDYPELEPEDLRAVLRVIVTTDNDFEQMIWLNKKSHCGILRLENLPRAEREALLTDALKSHSQDLYHVRLCTLNKTHAKTQRR
jgi:uncharacterized protein (DUF433 family)